MICPLESTLEILKRLLETECQKNPADVLPQSSPGIIRGITLLLSVKMKGSQYWPSGDRAEGVNQRLSQNTRMALRWGVISHPTLYQDLLAHEPFLVDMVGRRFTAR